MPYLIGKGIDGISDAGVEKAGLAAAIIATVPFNVSVLCFNIIEKISDYHHNKTGTFFNLLKKMCQFCYGDKEICKLELKMISNIILKKEKSIHPGWGWICEEKMKEKIYEEIVMILKEICEDGIDEIKMEDDLKEKGVSSLVFIQMLVSLEEQYDFVFDDEMLDQGKLSSIDAVVNYVMKMIQ